MPARSPTSSTSSNAFSRFSRNLGFGLNPKSHSSSPFGRNNRESVRPVVQEEQWYIPYNGPYEPPPAPKPLKRKDSWGDPIYGEAGDLYDVDVLLGDPELQKRYGGNHVPNKPSLDSRWSEDGEEDERKGRTRDRVMSTVSGRTVSSGTVDPGRTSFGQQRRSTISHTPQSIAVNGSGIGDSPMPVTRNSSQKGKTLKKGQTTRKEIPPTPQWRPDESPLMFSRTANYQAIPRHPADKNSSAPPSPKSPTRSSISDEWNNQPSSKRNFQPVASGLRDSLATTDEEYYASYYSSLAPAQTTNGYPTAPPPTPKGPRIFNQNQSEHQAKPSMSSSTSTHPYAYVFPSAAVHPEPPTPQTAPLSSTLQNNLGTYQYPRPPQLIVTHPSRDASSAGPSSHALKNSVSTPNLRAAATQPFVLPKGKERWLSAETWCDAMLFPRPRFKMKDPETENGKKKAILVKNTPRIVSPPDSPIYPHDPSAPPNRKEAMPSRVLAHSRSLVDLNKQTSRGELSNSSSLRPLIPPSIQVQPLDPNGKPTRPRSFAWDDMALPSPIPSLSKVLEEGEILAHQRKKWQHQAQKSIGNKRARSLSRSRTKSTTKRADLSLKPERQGPVDFLAARAFLGNQDALSVSTKQSRPRRTRMNSFADGSSRYGTATATNTMTTSRTSHSHSGSKSSKSHSGTHSRTDSMGRSALKVAKALCGADETLSPQIENIEPRMVEVGVQAPASSQGHESSEKQRTVRLAEPLDLDRTQPSPSPSAISDSRVAIAMSTPPPQFINEVAAGREEVKPMAHPYANSRLIPSVANDEIVVRGSQYAGPIISDTAATDVSLRHRLPPQVYLHPYARNHDTTSIDSASLIAQHRLDSTISPTSKMWAQLSPGVLREILPHEFQYSPFMSEKGGSSEPSTPVQSSTPKVPQPTSVSGPSQRQQQPVEEPVRAPKLGRVESIYDNVGLGEILFNALGNKRLSRDSGIGTSEEHSHPFAEAHDIHSVILHPFNTIRRKPIPSSATSPSSSLPSAAKSSSIFPSTKKSSSLAASSHVMSPSSFAMSSPLEAAYTQTTQTELRLTPPPRVIQDDDVAASQSSPSDSANSSSPDYADNADDLENEHFRDLFYRPDPSRKQSIDDAVRPTLARNSGFPWEPKSAQNRRTQSSGLTSLARQLSEEFGAINPEYENSLHESQRSNSIRAIHRTMLSQTSSQHDIRFVMSSNSESTSLLEAAGEATASGSQGIFTADTVPEDVHSSSSSIAERESVEDETLRMGEVLSVSTPDAISSTRRVSFTTYVHDDNGNQTVVVRPRQRNTLSSVYPPRTGSSDPTRSSYLTTSTRISDLSDFPLPPSGAMPEDRPVSDFPSTTEPALASRPISEVPELMDIESSSSRRPTRMTFGGDEDAEEFLASLSGVRDH